MSAVVAIRHLLVGNSLLTAAIPASRIYIGLVPLGAQLPAIGITTVSGVPRSTLSMAEPRRLIRERIQVTVYAKAYPDLDRICDLVGKALPNTYDTIAGLKVQSIIPSTLGPDIEGIDPKICIRSRDHHVTYLQ